jgi:SOS-response transcriptional repressor LexA
MNTLSLKQQAIYHFIQNCLYERGLPPTVREIGQALGITSTGNVQYHLEQLEKMGYIKREEPGARGIRLVPKGLEVRGRIADGEPLEIFEVPERLFDLVS